MAYPTLKQLASWGIETVSIHPVYAYPYAVTVAEFIACGTGKYPAGHPFAGRTRTVNLGHFSTLLAAHKAYPTAMILSSPPPLLSRKPRFL